MKKIIIASILSIVIVLIIGYIKIQKNEPRQITTAVNALPSDIGLFIHIPDIEKFFVSADKQSSIFTQILSIKQHTLFTSFLQNAKKILSTYPNLLKTLNKHNAIVAFRRQGKNDINILIVIETKSKSDQEKFSKNIAPVIKDLGYKTSITKYNKVKVYNFQKNNDTFYLSFVKGLILITESELLLQNSIRQLTNNISILQNPDFKKISNINNKESFAAIFINYFDLWTIFVNNVNLRGKLKLSKLKNFANWTELDINPDKNILRLYGYTTVEKSSKKYLNIFSDLEGAKISIDKFLPQKTIQYIIFGFNDFKKFYSNYYNYLIAKNLNSIYQQKNELFKQKYGFDPSVSILSCIGKTIAIVDVKYNVSISNISSYLILEIENKSCLQKLFKQYSEKYAQINHKKYNEIIFKYKANNSSTIPFYTLPEDNFFDLIIGKVYKLPKHKYYFFLDNYLIMSNSLDNLKLFADSYFANRILEKDKNYINLRKNLTPKSAITYFSRAPLRNRLLDKYITKNTLDLIRSNTHLFYGLNNIALQLYPKDDLFITYAYIDHINYSKTNELAIWEKKLQANINTKPFIFINHYTKEREIFVGDSKGNIYLFDNKGKMLWTRQIGEPITGDIYIIDYYNNGKYQLLFNTQNKIYIIDRLGRNVENFPITLPASVSTSISVFDYEKDGNYRIFAPCINNRVYLYNMEGKLNPGWLITKTSAPVKTKVQHFIYKNKDYIVFADDIHTYILNRRGQTRIPVYQTFNKSSNTKFFFIPKSDKHKNPTFLTTTTTGKLVFIDLKGKLTIIPLDKKFTDNHYFVLSDWDGNGSYEFIFLEDNKLYVYNQKLKPIFTQPINFKGNIIDKPYIYRFSKNDLRIGFITSQNYAYLINNKGQVDKAFPKIATTPFTITILNKEQGLNIILGKHNYLVNFSY